MRNLIFILGDQLSASVSSLKDFDKNLDAILMAEVWDEAKYAPHHQKKLVLIFSAMRHFRNYLQENGYKIFYTKLDEKDNRGSFDGELLKFYQQLKPQKIIVTEPSEYRVLKLFNDFQEKNKVSLEIRNDDRFICSHHEFANFVKDKKTLLLENFYHQMRKKTKILMEEPPKKPRAKSTTKQELKPVGGKWNYDKENRQTMPAEIKPPKILKLKTSQITLEGIAMVKKNFPKNFGEIDNFNFATSAFEADLHFADFLQNRLKNFGNYQDAMRHDVDFGFHSIISMYINIGLLDALTCAKKVEEE